MDAVAQLDGALGERAGAAGAQAPGGASRLGSASSFPRLHPGPGAAPEQVASDQRARIFAAMIELVSERGFGAVKVRELVRVAGVSTHTFYEHFKDKEECFICTYELLVRRSRKRVGAAQKDCGDWRERLRLAFCAWAEGIARDPRAARLALVEAFAGGPAALEQMRRAEASFEAMIERSFAGAPDPMSVPPPVVKGLVAGLHRVARVRLLSDRAHELPALADALLEWMLCFRCRDAAALARLDDPPASPPPGTAVLTDDGAERGDDRARILDAVARLAAEEGYWQLTVPRIRSAAGVSRKRFDQHFDGVQGCFIAALEHHTGRVLTHVAPAGAAGGTWPGGLHRALHALCAYTAADPVFARLGFIEVFGPGPDGVLCRERLLAGGVEGFRASAPAGQCPSELAAEASIGAVWGIVHRHVASGRAHRLPNTAWVLSYLALAPAIGARQAVQEITAEHERMREQASPRSALAPSVD
jgi:AcrR family transcriptional regulator